MGLNILFLQHRGKNTRDIFADIVEGYREAGHNALVLELGPILDQKDAMPTPQAREEFVKMVCDQVLALVATHKIDLCMCMWGNGPAAFDVCEGQNFFDANKLPLLMHWLDAPQWAHESRVLDVPTWVFNGPYCFHYINNQATAQEMSGVLGFSNIVALSNAASPTSFRPVSAGSKEFDIVFGIAADHTKPTPLMLKELKNDEPDLQAIRAEAAASLHDELCEIATCVSNADAPVKSLVDLVIEKRLQSRDVPVLQQIGEVARSAPGLSATILSLLGDPKRYVRFSSALRRIDSWERAFTFTYLSRYFRCATFGLEPAFQDGPGNWVHLGCMPYHEQSAAYGRSWFGLNVMRWQDDFGLNLKPFEITLSGTCLLQSYRVGIEDHFDESQMVLFRTPQHCRRKVTELLSDTKCIERIAAAGRARSLARHCWKHRAAAVARAIPKR